MKGKSQIRGDIFHIHQFRWLLQKSWFPFGLQVATLAGVAFLAINGWHIGLKESPEELLLLRKTNITTLFVWGIWWPAMIVLALGLGRSWCTVCPMELVNRIGEAAGRKVGWPRLRLSRGIRAGWIILLAYLVLQILVAGFSIHRVPHYTSVMLIFLCGIGLFTGLLFREQRSFCKGFCPSVALLSVYGRYTPIQLDIRDPSVCEGCGTKDCVAIENRYRFDGRSCPSTLRPFRRDQSDRCVLCFQCAKVCPHENIGFGIVNRTATSRKHRLLKPFEAAFVMVAAGFVAHEVVGEVKWLDGYYHAVPNAINTLMPAVGFGWFEALWFLILFPAILWGLAVGLAGILGYRGSFKKLVIAAATGAAPVIAVAHLAKAANKISSWAGFIPSSVSDPRGMKTFREILREIVDMPDSLLSFSLIGGIMLITMCVVGWRSWSWAKGAATDALPAARAGFTTAGVFFSTILIIWLW